MKKSDILLYFAMGVIFAGIIIVVIFKFVLVPKESFAIHNMDKIIVSDLEGNKINFLEFLKKDDTTYGLIFGLYDCGSCIYKGIEDLKVLKNAGKSCFGLVVHDNIEEAKGWATHYNFLTILVLKRLVFFENIKCVKTPVLVKFVKGKISSYRYIIAN